MGSVASTDTCRPSPARRYPSVCAQRPGFRNPPLKLSLPTPVARATPHSHSRKYCYVCSYLGLPLGGTAARKTPPVHRLTPLHARTGRNCRTVPPSALGERAPNAAGRSVGNWQVSTVRNFNWGHPSKVPVAFAASPRRLGLLDPSPTRTQRAHEVSYASYPALRVLLHEQDDTMTSVYRNNQVPFEPKPLAKVSSLSVSQPMRHGL